MGFSFVVEGEVVASVVAEESCREQIIVRIVLWKENSDHNKQDKQSQQYRMITKINIIDISSSTLICFFNGIFYEIFDIFFWSNVSNFEASFLPVTCRSLLHFQLIFIQKLLLVGWVKVKEQDDDFFFERYLQVSQIGIL